MNQPTKNLFTFACRNQENIQLGVAARLWAVASVSGPAMKRRITNAAKHLHVGSYGLICCTPLQSFTMPFVVRSIADPERVVDDVWPEGWRLPFEIEPFGDLSKRIYKDDAASRWPFVAHKMLFDGKRSALVALNGTPSCAFVPVKITDDDWSVIRNDLAWSDVEGHHK